MNHFVGKFSLFSVLLLLLGIMLVSGCFNQPNIPEPPQNGFKTTDLTVKIYEYSHRETRFILDAEVSVLKGKSTIDAKTTDESGEVLFKLPEGRYTVHVTKKDYRTSKRKIEIPVDNGPLIEIQIFRGSDLPLEDVVEELRQEVINEYIEGMNETINNWYSVDSDGDGEPDHKVITDPEKTWKEELKSYGKVNFGGTSFCIRTANHLIALIERKQVPDGYRNNSEANNLQELCNKMVDEEDIVIPLNASCGPQDPPACREGFYIELDGTKISEEKSLKAASIVIKDLATGEELTEPLFKQEKIKVMISHPALETIALEKTNQ